MSSQLQLLPDEEQVPRPLHALRSPGVQTNEIVTVGVVDGLFVGVTVGVVVGDTVGKVPG